MFVAAMPNITFWHDFVWFSFPMWARRFFFRFKLTFSYGISVSLLRKKITDPPRQIVKQECISPPQANYTRYNTPKTTNEKKWRRKCASREQIKGCCMRILMECVAFCIQYRSLLLGRLLWFYVSLFHT